MAPKVDIYRGRDPRSLPLYSVAEAAQIVRMNATTLRSWAFGRNYTTRGGEQRWPPLIEGADPKGGRLSFTNLVELHVLSILRHKRLQVPHIRNAMKYIRREMGTKHPLADIDVTADARGIYVQFFGKLINAANQQVQLEPVVAQYLERIERNERGFATRLFPMTRENGPLAIVIDPLRRFGRPILASANVETSIIAERWRAGESAAELAADFDVTDEVIEEALRYEDRLRIAA